MLYSIHGELVIRLLLLIQFRSFYVASVYSIVSSYVQKTVADKLDRILLMQ